MRQKDMALKVTDLDVNGEDLITMGIEKGPQIGYILNKLLDIVIEDPLMNDKDKLIEKAREIQAGGEYK